MQTNKCRISNILLGDKIYCFLALDAYLKTEFAKLFHLLLNSKGVLLTYGLCGKIIGPLDVIYFLFNEICWT